MGDKKIISVVICTYNGEKYVKEQLESVLNQTILPTEIIISDDCSTDNTLKVINEVICDVTSVDVKVFANNRNLKTIKNFENAISKTSGDWIFLSDQDDIWYERKIETMLEFAEKFPKTKLLFTNAELIDENGNLLEVKLWEMWKFNSHKQSNWLYYRNSFKSLVYNENYVTGATVMFSRNLLRKALPISVPYGYYHDAWLALHAAAIDGLSFLDVCTIKYRIHSEQQVGINNSIIQHKGLARQTISAEKFRINLFLKYPVLMILTKLKRLNNRI